MTTLPDKTLYTNDNAFYRGRRDFKKGKISSPFIAGTLYDKEWERGFNSAYFQNLRQVHKEERKPRYKRWNGVPANPLIGLAS